MPDLAGADKLDLSIGGLINEAPFSPAELFDSLLAGSPEGTNELAFRLNSFLDSALEEALVDVFSFFSFFATFLSALAGAAGAEAG